MPYEPTTWKSGDVVTSAKLNKIEGGIANAVLIVHDNDGTLDKTWQEIHDAGYCLLGNLENGIWEFIPICGIGSHPDHGCIIVFGYGVLDQNVKQYLCQSADDYPNGGEAQSSDP